MAAPDSGPHDPGENIGKNADATALALEVRELRFQLQEAQDTLKAIQNGDVDALIVGTDIYTLDSSNATINKLRQDVLAQMDDPVLAFDLNEHLVFMNPAAERLYGKDASSALGSLKSTIFIESWGEDNGESATEMLSKQGAFHAVSLHRTPDGASIHVETRVSVLKDSNGNSMGQLYVVRNISDRVAGERALRDADRRKDEFLATLAHELRNPLAPIRNALQIIRLTPRKEVHDNATSIIERQLKHMVRLVDDLLDVSRISQGKVQLQLEQADLADIVRAAIETSRPLIDSGGHKLKLNLPADALMVRADVIRLAQVISNLLNNAAKYTPARGSIEVSVNRKGGDALVSVKDSGVGIAREFLPQVFDLFTQVGRSRDRSQGGLGIGLALVKRLMEMHGGEVWAASAGTGQGSEFTIRIPLSPLLGQKPAVPDESIESPDYSGLRVLIVDDNADSADSLAQFLELAGYQTRTTYDGEDALRTAESFLPQVVVLDIGLPRLSGHEVARRIRQADWGREILLIALSGWGNDEDKKKSLEAGFDCHFVKPVDLHLLSGELSHLRP